MRFLYLRVSFVHTIFITKNQNPQIISFNFISKQVGRVHK